MSIRMDKQDTKSENHTMNMGKTVVEDFDEDYCHGCESGIDCASAHTEKCQQHCCNHIVYNYNSESEEDEDYCYGCESGVDCASAHTEKCQQMMKQN